MLSKTSFVMLNEVKHLAYASCQNSCQRAKCKLVYDFYASAAEINENHKSLRGILAFPLRASDLKVVCRQDDKHR